MNKITISEDEDAILFLAKQAAQNARKIKEEKERGDQFYKWWQEEKKKREGLEPRVVIVESNHH